MKTWFYLPAQLSIKWFCTMVDIAEINNRHTVEQISCCLNIYWLPHKLTKYIQSYNLELKSSQQRYQNRCIFFVHFDACYGGLAAFMDARGGPGPGIGPPNRRIIFNLFSVDFQQNSSYVICSMRVVCMLCQFFPSNCVRGVVSFRSLELRE